MLALLSGLYVSINRYSGAFETIYYGFPYAWLETAKVFIVLPPVPEIPYVFSLHEFLEDFLVYGAILLVATYICFRAYRAMKN